MIYLGLGYFLADKSYANIYLAIFFASLGNAIGNFILYYVFFFKNQTFANKLKKYLNFDETKIQKYIDKAQKHSCFWVFFGKLTPSVKVFIPIIAAMLKIRPLPAFVIFFTASFVWGFALTYIGIYFGRNTNLVGFYVALLLVFIVISIFFKMKRQKGV